MPAINEDVVRPGGVCQQCGAVHEDPWMCPMFRPCSSVKDGEVCPNCGRPHPDAVTAQLTSLFNAYHALRSKKAYKKAERRIAEAMRAAGLRVFGGSWVRWEYHGMRREKEPEAHAWLEARGLPSSREELFRLVLGGLALPDELFVVGVMLVNDDPVRRRPRSLSTCARGFP